MESEDFAFTPGLTAETDWDVYCASLQQQRAGIGLPSGWVPSTFLVAEIGGRIVGRRRSDTGSPSSSLRLAGISGSVSCRRIADADTPSRS